MLSKLTRGNQVTIPKPIVKRIGLKVGIDYLDVEYKHGVIYLKPVEIEDRVPPETWEKFVKKSLKKDDGDIAFTGEEPEGFLKKRARKAKK